MRREGAELPAEREACGGDGVTHRQYERFMERVELDPHPCKYGHINCSDRRGGPCCDEEAPPEEEDE